MRGHQTSTWALRADTRGRWRRLLEPCWVLRGGQEWSSSWLLVVTPHLAHSYQVPGDPSSQISWTLHHLSWQERITEEKSRVPGLLQSFFKKIEVYLIYNVVLVSGVQQNDSVIHTYILFHILFYYGLSQDIEYMIGQKVPLGFSGPCYTKI